MPRTIPLALALAATALGAASAAAQTYTGPAGGQNDARNWIPANFSRR
ncbi:MAG TPA: hypothetical protein VMM35_10625 [Longimicrobiales bacterium]|nr:hypothetical protein [Longimicrobiales bacterium]